MPPVSLDDLSASYFDLRWSLDPVAATADGITTHDHRFGSFTEESVRQHVAALRALANAVEDLSIEALEDEVDRTALINEIRVTVHRFTKERPHTADPGFWLNHIFEGLYQLLAQRDRPLAHRQKALVARLLAIPGFLKEARATLAGSPSIFVETALDVAAGGNRLLADVTEGMKPDGDTTFGAAVDGAGAALVEFVSFLRAELLPRANGSYAIGLDAFEFRLRFEHALKQSAEQLWRYGNRLVDEVEAEITSLAKEIDPRVRWPDLVDRLRACHPPVERLVSAYADEMERARRFVEEKNLVPIPPGRLEVIATPQFLRPLIPFAAYQPPGAFSEDRTGRFYVTPPDGDAGAETVSRLLRDHCVHELASTALHEGYPGHHLQFLAAQGQHRPIRKLIGTPLTIEGWALYCEEMMDEVGFYRSIEERFFQRVHLLWRAVRIVLDVGLHTRGLTFEEAVQMLVDRVHFERANAEAEVRRYCAYPAYQLCYAVGRRELRALRDAYRLAAGDTYSLREFHSAVLAYGGLPVSLIRWGLGLPES